MIDHNFVMESFYGWIKQRESKKEEKKKIKQIRIIMALAGPDQMRFWFG